jgi:replicative DNA helicase
LIKEYGIELQTLFLRMLITNAELYTRVTNIINPLNFDKRIREAAKFIVEHTQQYAIIPEPMQIKASTGIDIDKISEMGDEHSDWFLNEFEQFTKRQELERAILKAADLLEKGEFDPVEKLIKDAVQISLQRDMGTDYFDDPQARLNRYFNQGGQVSTGWPQLDRILYGGFSRSELNIFSGGSGSGKSLVMMNLALNWLQAGLSGVYITLELSEELTSLRTDAMLTNMGTRDIRTDIQNTDIKVRMAAKKAGKYRVKALPAQSNVNAIRSYIKEVQIQTGLKVDFVMIDYLDLVMPVSVKVNPNDQFIKDKYVSEELRNLAKELNVIMVTASQLNRSAVEEVEFDHSHIAGGISKIQTADNVFGIFTNRSMKERGKYQIQCMKSRTSTGVGKKIDLEYNSETMRITDSNPDDSNKTPMQSSAQILSKLRPNSMTSDSGLVTPTEQETSKISIGTEGARIKTLLNSLKENK